MESKVALLRVVAIVVFWLFWVACISHSHLHISQDEIVEIKRRQAQNRTADPNNRGYIRQKTTGKLWVRERIDAFLDSNSFLEVGSVAGNTKYKKDGTIESYTAANFVAGKGKVEGRDVIVAADDFAIRGGHADGAVWGKSASLKSQRSYDKVQPI